MNILSNSLAYIVPKWSHLYHLWRQARMYGHIGEWREVRCIVKILTRPTHRSRVTGSWSGDCTLQCHVAQNWISSLPFLLQWINHGLIVGDRCTASAERTLETTVCQKRAWLIHLSKRRSDQISRSRHAALTLPFYVSYSCVAVCRVTRLEDD